MINTLIIQMSEIKGKISEGWRESESGISKFLNGLVDTFFVSDVELQCISQSLRHRFV